MKEKIEKLARQLMNRRCRYGSAELTVLDYDFNQEKGRFYLYTDRKTEPYDRAIDDGAVAFLKEFVPMEAGLVPAQQQQSIVIKGLALSEGSMGKELKDVLLDNIKKIQENREYIPQAEAIAKSADSLIALCKVEVELVKAMRGA